jgi:predicted AlkP superfamily phosphohydrolase/phosphomutase
MKVDENGNELPEVDMTKSKAIMTRCNSIYINVKGRDPHGIVDPEDKYELEKELKKNLCILSADVNSAYLRKKDFIDKIKLWDFAQCLR